MYEDIYDRKIELERQLENEMLRMDDRREIGQRLRKVYAALGEDDLTQGEDPLIDKWERELEEGLMPDLDE